MASWAVASELAPPLLEPPALKDQTVRQIAFLHYAGNYVRVRFSNEFGNVPLAIRSATVALSAGGAAINPSTLQTLTFGGSKIATLAPHTKLYSDPVAMNVAAGSNLAVSYWTFWPFTVTSWHLIGQQENYLSTAGNHTRDSGGAAFPEPIYSYFLLDGVDVGTAAGTGTIVALGDSITDGKGSTLGANMRWPDQFASRLQNAAMPVSIVNAGITGGRVLYDMYCYGPSALHRFPVDALAQSGVRYVVFLEGLNDIVLALGYDGSQAFCFAPDPPVQAADIVAGNQQIIRDAHAAGLVIYGGTLTPISLTGEFETMRQTVNTWIRTSGAFDGFIDFDSVVRDPSNPTQLLPAYDSGDHLHPNDAGYGAMAQAIPLSLFTTNTMQRHPHLHPKNGSL